jgi:L-cysteine:1D-myo-inositol 2-amino-2-deoxy-alpha-D-glucopyranoside ligase
MSTRYLGDMLDLHSGGADLIFPHHECEIAQVEPITSQKPFVRIWMHMAMVHHQGEKMSKSLGNLVMVNDLLKSWSPDAIRLYLAMHHYRDSWGYEETELAEAGRLAERLLEAATVASGNRGFFDPEYLLYSFQEAMENDLDAPLTLSILSRLADQILAAAREGQDVRQAQGTLRSLAGIFGLRLNEVGPEPRVIEGWQEHLTRFI